MKGEKLLRSLGQISDHYIEEADAVPQRHRKRPIWVWASSVAACAVLCGALYLCLQPQSLPAEQQSSLPASTSGADTVPASIPPETQGIPGAVICMENIRLNENGKLTRMGYCGTGVKFVTWHSQEIQEHFGWSLHPKYIPAGLELLPECQSATVGTEIWNDAVVVTIDEVHMIYEEADTEGTAQVDIGASKLVNFDSCLTLPDPGVPIVTDLEGVEVIFAQITDNEITEITNVQEDSADTYAAFFTHNGISYEIITRGLPLEELVRITASIILDTVPETVPATEPVTEPPTEPETEAEPETEPNYEATAEEMREKYGTRYKDQDYSGIHISDAQEADISEEMIRLWYACNDIYNVYDPWIFQQGAEYLPETGPYYTELLNYDQVVDSVFTAAGRSQLEAAQIGGGDFLMMMDGKVYRLSPWKTGYSYGDALRDMKALAVSENEIFLSVEYQEDCGFAGPNPNPTYAWVQMRLVKQDGRWLVDDYSYPEAKYPQE